MILTEHLSGKTVEFIATQGDQLVIATTDGQQYRIGWRDGGPILEGIDARIVIAPINGVGLAHL